jgi:formylglycine-generating enzyme required for sulfatase activity
MSQAKRILISLFCFCLTFSCGRDKKIMEQPIGPGDGGTGTIVLNIRYADQSSKTKKIAAPSAISKVTAFVYDSYADSLHKLIQQDLTISGNTASGTLTVIARNNLVVDIVLYSAGLVSYLGRDEEVNVPSGGQATANIVLYPMALKLAAPAYAQAEESYEISWNELPFDLNYEVYEADNASFTSAKLIHNSFQTRCSVMHEETGTTYYYRARPLTIYGTSVWNSGVVKTQLAPDTGQIQINVPLPGGIEARESVTILPGTSQSLSLLEAQTITLGTASAGQTGVTVEWTQTGGPDVEIFGSLMDGSVFVPYEPGTYEFTRIERNQEGTVIDTETVTVVIPPLDYEELGISMKQIQDGFFVMGNSHETNSQYYMHTVSISAFSMGSTEITQSQFEAIMKGFNPSHTQGQSLPVTDVSWYDAADFCNRLSQACGFEQCYNNATWACDFSKNGFRLPTEAEWEYACRAGTNTRYYTGNEESDLSRAGWWYENSGFMLMPVGLKEPNTWGLFDTLGNVWEWCNDWFDLGYYSVSPRENPIGPSYSSAKALRGGGFTSYTVSCFWRSYSNPTHRGYSMGFRIVR